MSDDIDLPDAHAVTVGSIGPPGRRAFYLQVWHAGDVHTLRLEKQQVAALGEAITELLRDLPVPAGDLPDLPEVVDVGDPDWVVGTMGVTGIDETSGRVVLVLQELTIEDDAPAGAQARLGLSLEQLAALAARCEHSVAGGRPNCALCGRPMDPEGHVCPKTNGHATH
ncbi:MAG TPA: DUF3090 family protein [Acidimicrobiales bacterium]|nr:DUF3090 family protein [Acidimicrobiales bacterium]